MTEATATAIVNIEQAAAWNGDEGEVWTEQADRYDRAAAHHWQRLLDAERFVPTDRVLDIGCGTGKSARDVGRVVTGGEVVGVDLSAPMLELARSRAGADGLANVTFVQGDAQVHPFDAATFDVAISSFGAMFFGDPDAAFANIGRALRPGGRLALLAWRDLRENEWLLTLRGVLAMGRDLPFPPPDAPTPFSLADPARVRARLGGAGFGDITLTPIDEPIDFGPTVEEAREFARTMGIVRGLTDDLSDQQRAEGLAALGETLRAHAGPDGVHLASAAWLITARR